MARQAAIAVLAGVLVCDVWAPAQAQTAAPATPRPNVTASVAPSADPVVPPAVTPSSNPSAPAPAPAPAAPSAAARQVAPPATPPRRTAPLAPTLVANIDLTRQRIEIVANGATLHRWPISSGRLGYETPRGTFRGSWMAKMWYSRTYDDAPMPHSVFFNSGIAVHATSSTRLLGQPASHGCVRLSPANAASFYALVQKHGLRRTQFKVYGTTPVPPPAMASKRGKSPQRQALRPAPPARSVSRPMIVDRRRPTPPLMADGRGRIVLPPSSPYRGRESFVHNGVVYVRVR